MGAPGVRRFWWQELGGNNLSRPRSDRVGRTAQREVRGGMRICSSGLYRLGRPGIEDKTDFQVLGRRGRVEDRDGEMGGRTQRQERIGRRGDLSSDTFSGRVEQA